MRLLVDQLNENLVNRQLQIVLLPKSSTGSSISPARIARTAPGRCAAPSSAMSKIRSPRSSFAATSEAGISRSTSRAARWPTARLGRWRQAAVWPRTSKIASSRSSGGSVARRPFRRPEVFPMRIQASLSLAALGWRLFAPAPVAPAPIGPGAGAAPEAGGAARRQRA